MQFLLLTLLVGLTLSTSLHIREIGEEEARQLYEQFKHEYKKDYSNDVNEHRFKIFKDNLKLAQQYQAEERGTAEYGITQFSDLTPDEFIAMYAKLSGKPANPTPNVEYNIENMPKKIDWRQKGAVNPPQDQGNCGSCWAFSAIGNIEGQWFKKTGKLLKLSEQQLVDCDHVDHGCFGGLPENAYHELARMGGIETAKTYPYYAQERECKISPTSLAAYVNGSIVLDRNEKKQAAWLAENGPLSVGLNAKPLQFYKSGVILPIPFRCPASGINHGVLTVGYGGSWLMPYWIVKNSWGTSWGENGYFKIYRGLGTCGINLLTTSATIH